jgi:hypothetical protein
LSIAWALDFHVEDMGPPKSWTLAQLKPGVIAFYDKGGEGSTSELVRFEDWARTRPAQKKFLSLFPSYVEPATTRPASANSEPGSGKVYMYVAQTRFMLDRAPGSVDLAHYVSLPFLEKIDPSIKHEPLAPADVKPFKAELGTANDDPNRKWCTGRTTLVCFASTYKLEGKIPLGVMLVNKLRDSAKKVYDHIDFQSELSALSAADLDQAGLKELTSIDTAVSGVLEQNIFYVNEIMSFGKLLAVFQADPDAADKTVVTAFMALGIDGNVLDKKRDYENVPVLRNLVPVQVLMGQSSFNSGDSISGGLPKYARNEITRIAGILENDKTAAK